jgi:hypothetical protein
VNLDNFPIHRFVQGKGWTVNNQGTWDHLRAFFQGLGQLLVDHRGLVLLLIAWIVWWLWAVNWKHAWPVLARGGWAPLVLLMVMAALVWSRLAPGQENFPGLIVSADFWWKLGGVGIAVAVALFCGWLQGYFAWTPPEIELEPPAHAAPGHGHDHGHH